MSGKARSHLAAFPSGDQTSDPAREVLRHLADPQQGPLAEAVALADVLNVAATGKSPLADDTAPVITRRLLECLRQAHRIVEEANRSAA